MLYVKKFYMLEGLFWVSDFSVCNVYLNLFQVIDEFNAVSGHFEFLVLNNHPDLVDDSISIKRSLYKE